MSHSNSRVVKIQQLTTMKRSSAPLAFQLRAAARKTLTGNSFRVWDLLCDMAAFDTKNYSITISQAYLAEELGCTIKTINRNIAEIKKAGFIQVQQNYSKEKGTEKCTYYVDFPAPVMALAEAEKDTPPFAYDCKRK